MEETITVQETSELAPAEIHFQRTGDTFYIDIDVDGHTITLYPTREEIDNIRHSLFRLI